MLMIFDEPKHWSKRNGWRIRFILNIFILCVPKVLHSICVERQNETLIFHRNVEIVRLCNIHQQLLFPILLFLKLCITCTITILYWTKRKKEIPSLHNMTKTHFYRFTDMLFFVSPYFILAPNSFFFYFNCIGVYYFRCFCMVICVHA